MDRVERSLPQLLIELLSLHRASVGLPELELVIVFGMTNRAAIYARASPDCPLSLEEQLACLRCVAAERGWTVGHVFIDRPTTVRKGHDRRPGEIAVINAIQSGAIDRVLVWSIDRIGKSLVELVGFMETCRLHDVSLWVEEQKLDTATSNGMSLFDLSTMMASHLRQSRRDRIFRGQAAARACRSGLAGRRSPSRRWRRPSEFLAAGKGVRQVARMAGISPASVSRIKMSIKTEVAGICTPLTVCGPAPSDGEFGTTGRVWYGFSCSSAVQVKPVNRALLAHRTTICLRPSRLLTTPALPLGAPVTPLPAAPRGRRVERCRRDLWVIRTREVPRLCIPTGCSIAYQQFL